MRAHCCFEWLPVNFWLISSKAVSLWGGIFLSMLCPQISGHCQSCAQFSDIPASVRGDSFLGLGMRPALTPRHTLAGEQAYRACTTGCLTLAVLGSWSKFLSASGIEVWITFIKYHPVVRSNRAHLKKSSLDRTEISWLQTVISVYINPHLVLRSIMPRLP